MKFKIDPLATGMRIRNARKALQITQEQLGRRIGVTKGAISQWEKGYSSSGQPIEFKADNILRLASVLKANPYEIMYGELSTGSGHEPQLNYNNHPLHTEMIRWALETMDHAYRSLSIDISKVTYDEKADLFADLYKLSVRDPQVMKLNIDTALELAKFKPEKEDENNDG